MANTLDRIFFVGRPFSPLYGLAMQLRALCYRRGLLPGTRLPLPVISVGNLVLGGSGKTPIVAHVIKLMQNLGYRPAVVSRGYRGTAAASANIVSDGRRLLLSPEQAGDEPYLLARSLPGVPVLTGRRRSVPAQLAATEFQADCLVLDDGFQHLALHRDLDLVLFDASELAGNSRIFPGGPLREPVSALQRAHAFLLTGRTPENSQRADRFAELLRRRFPATPVFAATINGRRLVGIDGTLPATSQQGPAFAFCGIANPQRFRHSLAEINLPLTEFWPLADHQSYPPPLVAKIVAKAIASGAERLVTTSKDGVKLAEADLPLPLQVLEISQEVEPAFDTFLADALNALKKEPRK